MSFSNVTWAKQKEMQAMSGLQPPKRVALGYDINDLKHLFRLYSFIIYIISYPEASEFYETHLVTWKIADGPGGVHRSLLY